MGIQGIMTINGVEYKNSITGWGIKSLFQAMFDDVPFPTDLYLIVAGHLKGMTRYPGEPYPYSYPFPLNHDPDTLGAYVDVIDLAQGEQVNAFNVPYNITDWHSDGTPITLGYPPRNPALNDVNGFFEFYQDTPTLQRLKLTPFHFDGAFVRTDRFELNCPEAVNLGGDDGDLALFMLADSPVMYNNNSRLFSVAVVYDHDRVARAFSGSPVGFSFETHSFSEGAKFFYSFNLG